MKVYRIVVGEHVTGDDLVGIFEPAPADEVGTVEEQHDYRDAWLASPKPKWRPPHK